VIPKRKRVGGTSGKARGYRINLVRRPDSFVAHTHSPISCNAACSSAWKVFRKAKPPWGEVTRSSEGYTIYSSFKDANFIAKRIVTCLARFENSSEN
jgi:hypothetical protein